MIVPKAESEACAVNGMEITVVSLIPTIRPPRTLKNKAIYKKFLISLSSKKATSGVRPPT